MTLTRALRRELSAFAVELVLQLLDNEAVREKVADVARSSTGEKPRLLSAEEAGKLIGRGRTFIKDHRDYFAYITDEKGRTLFWSDKVVEGYNRIRQGY